MPDHAPDRLLIYGAYGFTARLILEEALNVGLRPVLAGRNEAKLREMAARTGMEFRAFSLDDPRLVERALEGVAVVLNTAGPFSATAGPLATACLRTGAHYLDITGEVVPMEETSRRSAEARKAGVMLMPGVGFDVVPSDCLAVHAGRRAPRPRRLSIGVSGLELFSRGSARTIVEGLDSPTWIRRQGRLTTVRPASLRHTFDYGKGPRDSTVVSWGDVSTAYFSTGIPNIAVYFESTPALRLHNALLRTFGWAIPLTPWQAWLNASLSYLPEGPSDTERSRRSAVVLAEVEDDSGQIYRSRLRTPEVYSFTALTSVAVAQRVLRGDFEPGFQTAARIFGPDFVLTFPGVEREDL